MFRSAQWSRACSGCVHPTSLIAPRRRLHSSRYTWAVRPLSTSSGVSQNHRNRNVISGGGLWGTHLTQSPPSGSLVSTAATTSSATREGKRNTPTASSPRTETVGTPPGSSSPNFSLDPPFTRVEGEAELSPGPCVYVCRVCQSVVFHSDDLAPSSRVGRHDSGWPVFVGPLTASAIRLRTVRQKRIVAQCSKGARGVSAKDLSGTTCTPQQTLDLAVPPNSVAQRGLAVEGDLVRWRGAGIRSQVTRTWRETCLRDEHHRVDPVIVLGEMGAVFSPQSTNAHFLTRTTSVRRSLGIKTVTHLDSDLYQRLSRRFSTSHWLASAATTTQQQREAAWRHFIHASRQLYKSVKWSSFTPSPEATTTSATSAQARLDSTVIPASDDYDEALMAVTPRIALRMSSGASNAALMSQLGVIDHIDHRIAAQQPNTKEIMGSCAHNNSVRKECSSLPKESESLLRVCRAGIQAQVSSFVILQHLWRPFAATPAVPLTSPGASASHEHDESFSAPTVKWAASLPGSVRLLLLTHELQRVHRRHRYANRVGHRDDVITTEESTNDSDKGTVCTRSHMWAQTVQESRAVVLCCCARWLSYHSAPPSSPTEDRETQLSLRGTLFSPLERQVLEGALRICAVCHDGDVAHALMDVLIRGVDDVASDISGRTAEGVQPAEEASFVAWYTDEATALYESAIVAAGTPCAGGCAEMFSPMRSASNGFSLAYSYTLHRGVTMVRLDHVSSGGDSSREGPTVREDTPPSASSGRSWSSFVTQNPRSAMRLVAALSGSVDANADHLHIVLQLYMRLVEGTDVGYSSDSVADTRRAFCGVLDALARVQLKAETYLSFLEDVYRRTLISSDSDVTQHPDVLASCLRVCSVAGASSRAVALFNRLCEPSSRQIAAEERNMAAVLSSTPGAAATVQRLLSFLHTKLPVTADMVHAAAAQVLVMGTESVSADSSSVFCFFDLLELTVAAQHHVTTHTAASVADRTFFLRVLSFLAGLHEQRCGGSAVCGVLSSPEVAMVLRQWIASATRNGQQRASWASALPPVTVGLLQELVLELRRAQLADDQLSSDSSSAVRGTPLLAAVEEILGDVADGLPTSVRPICSLDSDGLKGCSTLYCLPASLQWHRQQREWQCEEWKRFVDGAFRLLQSPCASAARETSCIRYQDWAVLHDVESKYCRVTTHGPLADAWINAALKGRGPAHASGMTSSPALGAGTAEGTTAHVLTPLAEVEWWILQDLESPPQTPLLKVARLEEILGVVVPSAVGCPTHTWANEPAVVGSDARRRRRSVVVYWLQRWMDSVETDCPSSLDSVFRTSVAAMLQRSASTIWVPEAHSDDTEQDKQNDAPSTSSSGSSTPLSPDSAHASAKRSGLETIFVRGPSSLVYRT